MGIFAKDVPGGAPTALDEDRADSFESLLKLPVAPAPANTVIAAGMTVTGSIQGEGAIHIEGKVVGEIDLKGSVMVAREGEIQGPVTADAIQVAGRVEGNITARDQLRLEAGGGIDGDISAAALTIETGGSFNGRSTMLKQKAGPPHAVKNKPAAREAQPPRREESAPRDEEPPREPRQPARPEPKRAPEKSAPPSSFLLDDDDDDDFPPRRR